MKNIILLFILFACTFISGCAEQENPKIVPDINVVNVSEETDWDYWVGGSDDYFFLKTDGPLPRFASFFSSETNKDYAVFFTEDGYLDKIVVDDYIFILRNPDGNLIDIGIIYPNDEVEIIRNVQTEYDWSDSAVRTKAQSDNIRWAARAIGAIPCVMLAVSGLTVVTLPSMIYTCGTYIASLTANILVHEFDIHNGFTEFMSFYGITSLINNTNPGVATLFSVASRAFHTIADEIETIENDRADDIRVVEGALEYGYGDVQVTLTWNNTADVDLYVYDPFGETIYWYNKVSESGGKLDVDDRNGYGPENIFWPSLQAPAGTYEVYVHHYSGATPSNYTVLVNAFGRRKTYSGSISYKETVHIADFDSQGIYSTRVVDKWFDMILLEK
ncbi:MAG: hypothetical protein PHS48_02295 [Bacteroidales bacterium]|jgi:hypothetical protein|nr:hypothetical protein [Bacteroidales bacterium]